jgi:hypothetical protein
MRTVLPPAALISHALFVWTYQQNQQPSSSVFLSQQTSEQCFQHNKPAKRTGCGRPNSASLCGYSKPASIINQRNEQHNKPGTGARVVQYAAPRRGADLTLPRYAATVGCSCRAEKARRGREPEPGIKTTQPSSPRGSRAQGVRLCDVPIK